MSYIQPQSRQQFSLPITLDDYVSSENIVRFIDVFVDKMVKKSEIGYSKGKGDIGRSAYQFSVLLKIYIYGYGYLNSISSSRKLENECCK
ncbi:hypothetical protein FACS189429_5360 [Bacteroidia bacterium]|nr:hypothetical protein FACS189429_5360 [Bacteroidia bacterium]